MATHCEGGRPEHERETKSDLVPHQCELATLNGLLLSLTTEEKQRLMQAQEALNTRWRFYFSRLFVVTLSTTLAGCVAGTVTAFFLGLLCGFILELVLGGCLCALARRRVKRMHAKERRWHEGIIALCENVTYYNEKILSLLALVPTIKPNETIPHEVMAKCRMDHDALERRREIFRQETLIKNREEKLRQFADVLAKDKSGGYRETRDVTDMVFAENLRVQLDAEVTEGLNLDEVAVDDPTADAQKRLGS